ncbi:Cytochrome P450 [Flavobacterium sp. CF108]|uniref:cytochrome P450 n=1 Tax=unclassified Flavobacterium TaxID=196869 RepID=UPI0008CF85E3|nr:MULTISPECIES: cytochrome P450 [unclassified Flavobacterium]SEO46704.1 Cytochrome P450 [Flavobacterium sp. fv08]SHH70526.1 Cytochrome P450 [Flavobacterium sp. CF108]
MISALFLQSNTADPYLIYKNMLENNSVYWDETNKIWAIYSYEDCVSILKNPKAEIPPVNPDNKQKLNKTALEILNNLTRLSNGIRHEISKEIAMLLFSNMKSVDINSIISQLIQSNLVENKMDWVNSICKKLPVLVVLKSFGFEEKDCDFISNQMEFLVKIMLPQKTEEQIKYINEATPEIFSIVEKQLSSLHFYESIQTKISETNSLSFSEIKTISISNLIGLFIQSFDAGKGILSNSLLQILNHKTFFSKREIEKSVIETLRFDPPIHNTRRIAVEDIFIGESQIKKNDSILVVLASANRDPKKFEKEFNFDMERNNNAENLTFGIGGHICLAKHFSIHLAAEALWFLFNEFKTVKILENNIQYEPMINTRLPKTIWISLQ